MIIADNNITINKNFEGQSESFNVGNEALVIEILRNKLYENPVRIVLQEYISNAFDAHIEANIQDTPIEVTLADHNNYFLTITDFGNSMTKQQMFSVFTKYGISTKNQCNDYTGGFGIGSKSAWSYTDSFNIITNTCENNINYKRVYCAYIDETKKGKLLVVSEEVTPNKKTGTSVIIAIKPDDVSSFNLNFQVIYSYHRMPIKLNNRFAVKKHLLHTEENIKYYNHAIGMDRIIVVGNISYELSMSNNLFDSSPKYKKIQEILSHDIIPCFDIGELSILPNRKHIEVNERNANIIYEWCHTYYNIQKQKLVTSLSNVTDIRQFLDVTYHKYYGVNKEIINQLWKPYKVEYKIDFSDVIHVINKLVVVTGKLFDLKPHYFYTTKTPIHYPEDCVILKRKGPSPLKEFRKISFLATHLSNKYFEKRVTKNTDCHNKFYSISNKAQYKVDLKPEMKYYILYDKTGYYTDFGVCPRKTFDYISKLFNSNEGKQFVLIHKMYATKIEETSLLPVKIYLEQKEKEIDQFHFKNGKFEYYTEIQNYSFESIKRINEITKSKHFHSLEHAYSLKNHHLFELFNALNFINMQKYEHIDLRKELKNFETKLPLLFPAEKKGNYNDHVKHYIDLVNTLDD